MKNRSEASTFAGIPIPLTMETLLDVYRRAVTDRTGMAERQAEAIRERILRMEAEKDDIIEFQRGAVELLGVTYTNFVNRNTELAKRIAELEAEVEYMEELYVREYDTEPPKRKELSDVEKRDE